MEIKNYSRIVPFYGTAINCVQFPYNLRQTTHHKLDMLRLAIDAVAAYYTRESNFALLFVADAVVTLYQISEDKVGVMDDQVKRIDDTYLMADFQQAKDAKRTALGDSQTIGAARGPIVQKRQEHDYNLSPTKQRSQISSRTAKTIANSSWNKAPYTGQSLEPRNGLVPAKKGPSLELNKPGRHKKFQKTPPLQGANPLNPDEVFSDLVVNDAKLTPGGFQVPSGVEGVSPRRAVNYPKGFVPY
jgi:hypothetical protein